MCYFSAIILHFSCGTADSSDFREMFTELCGIVQEFCELMMVILRLHYSSDFSREKTEDLQKSMKKGRQAAK